MGENAEFWVRSCIDSVVFFLCFPSSSPPMGLLSILPLVAVAASDVFIVKVGGRVMWNEPNRTWGTNWKNQ